MHAIELVALKGRRFMGDAGNREQEKKNGNSGCLAPFYVVLRIFKQSNPCYRGPFSYDDAHHTIGRHFPFGGISAPHPATLACPPV
jgi:hypothetical protein